MNNFIMSNCIDRKDIDGLINLLAAEARVRYAKRITLGRATVTRIIAGEFFIIGLLSNENDYALQQIMWTDTRVNLLSIVTGSKSEKYYYNRKMTREEIDEILMKITLNLC